MIREFAIFLFPPLRIRRFELKDINRWAEWNFLVFRLKHVLLICILDLYLTFGQSNKITRNLEWTIESIILILSSWFSTSLVSHVWITHNLNFQDIKRIDNYVSREIIVHRTLARVSLVLHCESLDRFMKQLVYGPECYLNVRCRLRRFALLYCYQRFSCKRKNCIIVLNLIQRAE